LKNIAAAGAERGERAIKEGFDAAAKVPNASPGQSAQSKALLAQAQVEQAQTILRDVAIDDVAIARLVAEITDIAGAVAANNTAIAGFSEMAPKGTEALTKTLEGTRAQVQGKGGDAVWKLAGNAGQLPALSAATERAKKLAPQIKDLEGKKAKLVQDRAGADRKAAELLQQSRRQAGKKSVDLFEQSTKETARSAIAAKEIAGIDHQLMKLRQEEQLAQAQAAQLAGGAEGPDRADRGEQGVAGQAPEADRGLPHAVAAVGARQRRR
jgi:uncharacterized protein YhaN